MDQGNIDRKKIGGMMPRIFWIAFGLIAGFFARTIVGKPSPKGLLDILLAIIGALIGSWLFGFFDYASPPGLAALGERNIMLEVIGSAALLIIFQALNGSTD